MCGKGCMARHSPVYFELRSGHPRRWPTCVLAGSPLTYGAGAQTAVEHRAREIATTLY